MIKFEKVEKYKDADFPLPTRATANSAGYDFIAVEDYVIPSLLSNSVYNTMENFPYKTYSLEEIAEITRKTSIRPTLVSTGVKCIMPKDTYLEVSVRSSTPLKYLLIMANGVGIIDADYASNKTNDGEIFLQLLNLSPFPIQIKKGDRIGQGIIKHYLVTDDDNATGEREGGMGSTSNE